MPKRLKEPPRIVTIIPATGWRALYGIEKGDQFDSALICWALMEDCEGFRYVMGMDADSSGGIEEAAAQCEAAAQGEEAG